MSRRTSSLPRLFTGLVGLLLSAATLPAQSSVWKITRGEATLYLGGTLHLLRPQDFPLPAEFDQAFEASTKLVFETDLARLQSPEMMRVVASQGMFPPGQTLEKVLSADTWKTVVAYCETAGLPLAQMKQLRPWLFTVTIAAAELRKLGISNEGVDLHYFKQASERGKATGELETFERHIEFLTRLGAGHESEMIAKSLEELNEIPSLMHNLLAAWRAGDIQQIDELMIREMREKYPTVFKDLLVDRNEAWLPQLDKFLESPEVEFVLVGAGHLAGKEGLLAQLRARGCRIEQLKAAPAAAASR